jgi:hypothetical protein
MAIEFYPQGGTELCLAVYHKFQQTLPNNSALEGVHGYISAEFFPSGKYTGLALRYIDSTNRAMMGWGRLAFVVVNPTTENVYVWLCEAVEYEMTKLDDKFFYPTFMRGSRNYKIGDEESPETINSTFDFIMAFFLYGTRPDNFYEMVTERDDFENVIKQKER